MNKETDTEKIYNRVIIVGNGFDLACGLKSSYHDFILHIIKSEYSKAIENGYSNCDLFRLVYHSKHEDVKKYDSEKVLEATDFIELINYFEVNKFIKSTYINNLFKELIDVDSKNWVDIESCYFKGLSKIWQYFKSYSNREKDLIKGVKKLNDELTQISKALKEYLKPLTLNHNTLKMQKASFTDRLYEKLWDSDINNIPFEYRPENDPEKVLILNFNYTDFAAKYLYRKNADYIALHGDLTDYKNDIVFGYGDDTNEIYKEMEASGYSEFLEKIKSFQYGRDEQYHKLLNFINGENFEVFILGHSCGLSDKTLLKTIFEHENCYAIKAFHYGDETDHFYKRMAIARHFDDKIAMRQKVLPYDQHFEVTQFKN